MVVERASIHYLDHSEEKPEIFVFKTMRTTFRRKSVSLLVFLSNFLVKGNSELLLRQFLKLYHGSEILKSNFLRAAGGTR